MAHAWTDIAAGEIDSESPVTESLVEKFFDNQEALITCQLDTRFDEVSDNSGSWIQKTQVEVYVPPQVDTAAGDVTLEVRLEAKVDSGTTGQVGVALTGGTRVELAVTGTSYGFLTFSISSTDVKANADSLVNLEVWTKRDTGGGSVYARCLSGGSRFARAA